MARVVFAGAARTQLLALDHRTADAVSNALTLLESNPGAGHILKGRLAGLLSLRIGAYRIIYELRNRSKTIRIVAIVHRAVAYRSDPR